MKLGIDCDGVLRNFTGKLIEVYKREYPGHWCPNSDEDFYTFSMSPLFEIGQGIYDFAFRDNAKEIYGDASAYEGAKKFIDDLKKLGHKVYIVTSQPNNITKTTTLEWLIKHDINFDGIFFSDNKGEIDIDVLLDDYDKNLISCEMAHKTPICFTRTWNKNWKGERVNSYQEFIKKIRELEIQK